MNKRDIRKWLENMESKLKNKSRDKERESIGELKLKKIKAMPSYKDFEKISKSITDLSDSIDELNSEFEHIEGFSKSHNDFNNMVYLINRLETKGLDNYLVSKLSISYDHDLKCHKIGMDERNAIGTEFIKLRGNIKAMSGKEATVYLKGLGFDMPDKPKVEEVKNEILAPINMNVLNKLK